MTIECPLIALHWTFPSPIIRYNLLFKPDLMVECSTQRHRFINSPKCSRKPLKSRVHCWQFFSARWCHKPSNMLSSCWWTNKIDLLHYFVWKVQTEAILSQTNQAIINGQPLTQHPFPAIIPVRPFPPLSYISNLQLYGEPIQFPLYDIAAVGSEV